MPVPDFNSIMPPLLRSIKDGKEHHVRELISALADHFSLSAADRNVLQPSGGNRLFDNRFHWARKYLKEAGLLSAPRRAYVQITERGAAFLKNAPQNFSEHDLRQFPEFLAFNRPGETATTSPGAGQVPPIEPAATPEEQIRKLSLQLRLALANDLLDTVQSQTPAFFERLVLQLLLAMGYGGIGDESGHLTPTTGDQGIDGIIYEDRLGLDLIYVQAKKWAANVGRPEIQKFVGALQGQKARKGIFITTSSFSNEAREYAQIVDPKIILIDGRKLAELMIDFDVGIQTMTTYSLKQIDSDFFEA